MQTFIVPIIKYEKFLTKDYAILDILDYAILDYALLDIQNRMLIFIFHG